MTEKLTKEDWETIIRLHKDKIYSISELARQYNISRNSIYVYFRRRNLLNPVITKNKSKENKQSFIQKVKKWFVSD